MKTPRQLAIEEVCPASGVPRTPYEHGQVARLTAFAERVLRTGALAAPEASVLLGTHAWETSERSAAVFQPPASPATPSL